MTLKKFNRRTLLFLLVLIAVLSGCGSQPAAPVAEAQPAAETLSLQNLPANLDIAAVQQLRDRPDVMLIDVREDDEYKAGHIPGTVWIPLGEIPNRLNDIPKDKTVIAVCRSGNRSNQAAQFLREQGFDNVHNMQGGMNAWGQAGYEVAQ